MKESELVEWVAQPKINQILSSFSIPKTPRQVERELDIRRFNLKLFLKRNMLKCLNPDSYKGRIFILTHKARKLLNSQYPKNLKGVDWELLGWLKISPSLRGAILKTLSMDSAKRTSENIRKRTFSFNPNLTRIGTKNILNEMVQRDLVKTEIGQDRRRYYWISEKGKLMAQELK